MGKTRDCFKNIRDARGTLHIKMGTVKDRQFRYDLSQVPYHYTVKVTNRSKGLDLVERVPEKLWTEIGNTVQEKLTKPSPTKRKGKQLSEEALEVAEKKKKEREVKGKGEMERYNQMNTEFQIKARRDKKAFLSDQY